LARWIKNPKAKIGSCPRIARMIANLIHHKGTEDTKCSLTSAAFGKIWIEVLTAKRRELARIAD